MRYYAYAAPGLGANLPPLEQAAAWLESSWADYAALGQRIQTDRHNAAELAAQAKQAGDLVRAAQAKGLVLQLSDTYAQWDRWYQAGQQLLSTLGLGSIVIPLALATTALAVVAGAAVVIRLHSAQSRALELLATGQLTPEQAAALGLDIGDQDDDLLGIAGPVKWAALGLVALAAIALRR